jgi:3-oxoacyl-[acyl-carrier protein] reductase
MGRVKSSSTPGTAVVTGAARGIGRAAAQALAAAGHHVFINYSKDEHGAEETLRSIRDGGGSAEVVQNDVAQHEQILGLFEAVDRADRGELHVLVNNAGITGDGLLMELDDESLTRTWNVNLCGGLWSSQEAVRRMLPQRYGRIVNVSSVLADRPNRGVASYAASKGAINGFTRALALEVGKRGVTVNAVAPGFIVTDMTSEFPDAERGAGRFRYNAVGRPGYPEDVAAVIRFLASPESGFVNGQVITVDGGAAPFMAPGI